MLIGYFWPKCERVTEIPRYNAFPSPGYTLLTAGVERKEQKKKKKTIWAFNMSIVIVLEEVKTSKDT